VQILADFSIGGPVLAGHPPTVDTVAHVSPLEVQNLAGPAGRIEQRNDDGSEVRVCGGALILGERPGECTSIESVSDRNQIGRIDLRKIQPRRRPPRRTLQSSGLTVMSVSDRIRQL
jgi:hypothetical protein